MFGAKTIPTKLELELIKLRARAERTIDRYRAAKKGSDKQYKRECREEVENVRNLIRNVLKGVKHDKT